MTQNFRFNRPTLKQRLANALDNVFLIGILGLAVAMTFATPASAQANSRPFTILENGQSYATLQAAVDAIGAQRGMI